MAYPANVTFNHQEKSSRLWVILTLICIKALILIPHMIVLFVLQFVVSFVGLIGIFAVLFTGKYPRGFENLIVGVARWGWRMMSYYICMTDKYPPFTLKSTDYPADLSFEHQKKSSRLWALLTLIPVKYILLIPHMVVLLVMEFVAAFCLFVGLLGTLFMGRYPLWCEKVIVVFLRYGFRIGTYFMCLTDKYPPLGWKDNPGSEPEEEPKPEEG